MNAQKIVLLAGRGSSTNILYHALKDAFDITAIILEDPVSKREFIKRRIRALGLWKVTGQLLFQAIIVKALDLFSRNRKKEILNLSGLEDTALPSEKLFRVGSVNDERCLQLLQEFNPGMVIVNGTRIISERILSGLPSKFINIHAGITPKYRGVHGAYWALVNHDADHCGVTVHLVDRGIDTGAVIYSQNIAISPKDNFVTYPYLQLATGIPLLRDAILDIMNDRLVLSKGTRESRLWSHPTFRQYVYYRFLKGIR